MKQNKTWDLLRLFGEADVGETEVLPAPTPQASETGDDESAPAAEGQATASERQEEFRRLMEGEYKELFTAYFQETFNRRFKEQKGMRGELERAREMLRATAELLGVDEANLAEAIRAEHERKRALTEAEQANARQREQEASQREIELQLQRARDEARAEAEQALLGHIRARGLRPAEGGLSATTARALASGVSSLSRQQRAEVARRAAKGEHIKF